ncbi:hypothetical protein HDV05_007056 [Chytridiales sp. JEL 0842]|nr:hypothetical protein HDV05_007056 [Chytridiales sp. JEL 0842]
MKRVVTHHFRPYQQLHTAALETAPLAQFRHLHVIPTSHRASFHSSQAPRASSTPKSKVTSSTNAPPKQSAAGIIGMIPIPEGMDINTTEEDDQSTLLKTPEWDPSKLYPSDLLPNDEVLAQLHTSKKVSIPPEEQRHVVQVVLASFTNGLSNEDLTERLLKGIAKEKGDLDAAFRHAQMLSQGFVTQPKDILKAFEMLATLAERGHKVSQYVLGLHCVNDGKVEEGTTWIRRSADQGFGMACAQLGDMLQKGIYVERNAREALEYLKKAASAGVVEADFLVGTLYASGEAAFDGKPDPKAAFAHYQKAANKGLAVAQHNVGSIYFQGNEAAGIKKDIYLAVEYWKMAAAQNLPMSQVNLGRIYMEGITPGPEEPSHWKIDTNYKLARKYLGVAATHVGDEVVVRDATELLAGLDKLEMGKGDGLKNKERSKESSNSCSIL